MKKVILLLFVVWGCSSPNAPQKSQGSTSSFGDFKIQEIDGCEYVVYDYGVLDQRVYSITHKGNCKNCTTKSN